MPLSHAHESDEKINVRDVCFRRLLEKIANVVVLKLRATSGVHFENITFIFRYRKDIKKRKATIKSAPIDIHPQPITRNNNKRIFDYVSH